MHSSARRIRLLAILSTTSALAALAGVEGAQAQCVLVATAGDDSLTCSSGTHAGDFDDLAGNNTLTFPDGGSGTIDGNVTFGDGADRVEMHSGTITGNVTQGGGADTFIISDGVVLGAVSQGNGVDTFIMTGGTIGSLAQGSQLDFAEVHGGHIVGEFFAGDFFTMTGGRIGQVNLEQANNEMRMSGGVIDGFVIAAQHNDLLELSGGSIGGFVNLGSGNNTILVTGGSIAGDVLTSGDTDRFTWDTAGFIGGTINLGAGDDVATLRNLDEATLSSTPLIDGDEGIDQLTFDNTSATTAARYVNWEEFSLTNGSEFTLDTDFVLGDAGTGTGSFDIDASSTLFGGGANNAIVAFDGASPVTVTNAGIIDLTNGGASVSDTLTVFGNYVGAGGFLKLNTFLDTDGAPSDTFVISGAGNTASGSTGILITNTGGPGAFTVADGILVVEAVDGATTAPGSFSLAGPAAAGAREYLLFQGGLTGDNPENWYLRSVIPAAPNAPPAPEPLPPPPAPPGMTLMQLIRPEVAVHSVVPSMARALNFISVGTFHERQGEQALLRGDPALGTWGRLFGQHMREDFAGGVLPNFDGIMAGLQAGRDVLRFEHPSGHRDRAGVYVSHAHAAGDVRGFASGVLNARAGEVRLVSTSVGAYWTHLGPTDGYIDAVVQGSYIDGSPRSDRGVGADVSGFGFAASIEAGQPIPLGAGLILEPQAQAIWQQISLDDTADQLSAIRYGNNNSWIARVGARLQGTFGGGDRFWQPYIKANVWWNSGGTDVVNFGADAITTERNDGVTGEIGAGITGRLNQYFDVYAAVSYLAAFEGERRETIKANIGVRLVW